MEKITDWFKNSQDYYEGVALYASLPSKNSRVLKRLNKRKNNANMSLLASELRKAKAKPVKPKVKKIVVEQPKIITQEVINKEATQKQQSNESVQQEFGGIRYGDLPAELRPRYSRARNIFMEMIELKFALNELPASDQDGALKIIIHIDKLDEERDLIWNELHHWKKHKTLLPSTEEDFSKLTELQLHKKRNNLRSSITNIGKRVEILYTNLETATELHAISQLENKINRSEQRIHEHKLNIIKIDKLI